MSEENNPVDGKDLLRWAKETQRNIEFIVNQQAQFAADMDKLRERQERAEQRCERAEQRWERTEEGIRSLLSIAEIHEREIDALKEAQARTDRQMAETDERMNALINVVERNISGRRNGDSDTREA